MASSGVLFVMSVDLRSFQRVKGDGCFSAPVRMIQHQEQVMQEG